MYFKNYLLLLCISTVLLVGSVQSRCTDGCDLLIYGDALHPTVKDWSWASTRKFDNDKPTHSGNRSITWVVKNYEGIYMHLEHPIDPAKVSIVSLWVHGGTTGGQKLYVRFTKAGTPVSKDFFLWGKESICGNSSGILAGKWIQATINTNFLEPGLYDGIQILTLGTEDQGRVYVDDIMAMKRCATDPYRNYNAPIVCASKDCCMISAKPDNTSSWVQNGIEVQQYNGVIKNMNKKAITCLEFAGDWFSPRDVKKDIWGVEFTENGNFAIPAWKFPMAPGTEFTFGCVSKKGPVSFKVTYIEFAK
ncbi:hypothetical protein DLAC_10953 [Tieghemostelium lacteum]|uniref:Carbohydrate binding domain-containing protein n=1 Tax=Tieghemostelium lacteum TaxID=361077 RepID=A0A151Z2S9_TIELA|nr:hypothetical protein DLAC_10953 [Tieghemostelium lacteum]|eukprot:KYQ88260.1 hypothetical protein DLAC_10953 [Tieghemostelium lacteum]